MSRKERERKARQRARLAVGGEDKPSRGGEDGDAQPDQTTSAIFPVNPSPGELHNDARLLGRAVRERWASNDARRASIRKKLQDAILDKKTSDPALIATLVNADARLEAQNQRDDLAYDPFNGIAGVAGGAGDGEGDETKGPTYQQINFYLPSNGRGQEPLATNGDGGASD